MCIKTAVNKIRLKIYNNKIMTKERIQMKEMQLTGSKYLSKTSNLIYWQAVRYSFYFSDACLDPICFTSAADFPRKLGEHEANRWQQLRDYSFHKNSQQVTVFIVEHLYAIRL